MLRKLDFRREGFIKREIESEAAFLFRELRRDFGVREIDDENGLYYIFKHYYEPEDYVEFKRDEDDSLPLLYESEVQQQLLLYMTNVIHQRNAKYRQRGRWRNFMKEDKLEDILELLKNTYGVNVNLQNKTWRVEEGFIPAPLHIKTLRQELAASLHSWLDENGFTRLSEENKWAERRIECRIFSRPLKVDAVDPTTGRVTVRIRSSIKLYWDEVNKSGDQAIHVYAEYNRFDDKWDYERILFKAPKIMRVGNLNKIIERVADRVKCVEDAMANVEMCRTCGEAPLMTSRKGNRVCSHFCWTKSEDECQDFIDEELE